jgi:hypothetical protein
LKREESSARPQAGSELHYPSLGDSDSLVSAQIIRQRALLSHYLCPRKKYASSLLKESRVYIFFMLERKGPSGKKKVCFVLVCKQAFSNVVLRFLVLFPAYST